MIRAIFDWIAIAFYTIAIGVPATIVSLVFPGVVLRFFVRPWCKLILWTCGVKLKVEGADNLPKGPCVIMFNHQSYFDIFAFASALPMDWRAVMKRELGRIPFFGWVAKATGHYFIRRDASVSSMREVEGIAERIRSGGHSVLIAPEGTRSVDGSLGEFKPGGFVLALRARVPVVPMVIMGGKDVMRSGSLRINPGVMRIVFLPPIDTGSMPKGRAGRGRLSGAVREAMERVLDDERGVKPEGGVGERMSGSAYN